MTTTAARQPTLPDTVPPLSAAQEAALLYVEADTEAFFAKERANKRKDEMIRAAARAGVDTIKIHDASGMLHTYTIENATKLRHTKQMDVVIEKSADDLKA